ncbi:hypothetical protein E3Q22_02316 [Wallemia mellicola]|uniref:Uncharacterized protein n=2 Tax=Wallemia mellicola TaxID=1708541 RepID=A0A4T0LLH3_9BASI|nr:hypothetical protein WALSEDRAFT_60050 [Wallemia mellicola CBS 633.66]TIB70635.1 hypothetical protein E3Q24_02825 [Wallemia mellicola]EIM22402.1 hypothetical protein WALSEDRAFT_60050 [Wallemia mellicola CBS 633.66]TIB76341.1 hypothetical protein E3Q23_01891 [Wallemia mellicola]TIB79739.1 hypothetical protein E3Q22_02316 [Wallemia mellicola]TIB83226.1 hypothetical protein E3Q21_03021 [Wallemia mellicola]|eukprot:XP_006957649.1 hypothetical protein WALSEDRAFT_60050 [Wallemia mellicola CBS 633.66]
MENTVDDLHVNVPLFNKLAQAGQPSWPGLYALLTKNGGGFYLLLLGTLLGVQFWQSYIGAVITYKAKPFEARLASTYCIIGSTISSALLGRWIINHGHALDFGILCQTVKALDYHNLCKAVNSIHVDAFHTILLAKIALSHFIHLVFVGPATAELLQSRNRASNPEEVKCVDKKFTILRVISSSIDLVSLAMIVLHTLYIGYVGTSNL